jgi:hypothetical protein
LISSKNAAQGLRHSLTASVTGGIARSEACSGSPTNVNFSWFSFGIIRSVPRKTKSFAAEMFWLIQKVKGGSTLAVESQNVNSLPSNTGLVGTDLMQPADI